MSFKAIEIAKTRAIVIAKARKYSIISLGIINYPVLLAARFLLLKSAGLQHKLACLACQDNSIIAEDVKNDIRQFLSLN
jgi:hypothetical protein